MFTKKNRPGQILRVVADQNDCERLLQIIMEETGTLGVRVNLCERHILNRELHQISLFINDLEERVNVKVVKDSKGKTVQFKPEYEDIKRIAEKTNLPLREVADKVKTRAKETFL